MNVVKCQLCPEVARRFSCVARSRLSLQVHFLSAITLVLLLMFVGANAQPASDSPPPTCIVLTAEGQVEIAPKGKSEWQPALTNQIINVGDRIRTGLRSRATLRWSDMSVVRVDALTSMEIQPPQKSDGKPELDLKSGATYLFSREKPMEIQFRTPVASGAIRGTEFNLAVAENGRTELALLAGEVDLGNEHGSVTLKSGEKGSVEQGQAPTKTAVIDAMKVIQWALYYPAVVDPAELGFSDAERGALRDSLDAYRSGDLLQALKRSPENWTPGSDAERVYFSALLLSVGRVDEVEATLGKADTNLPTAKALREVIAVVRNENPGPLSAPTTASESIARSYTLQSRSQLPEALASARGAATKSPQFGAAQVRVAELEFGLGYVSAAKAALDNGLKLSPRNAQGLALNGFLLSAQNKLASASESFDQAIAADGSLGNAWLGRGLLKIRRGHVKDGLKDLEVAAAIEPQRAVLRSYLGKAFSEAHDTDKAAKELDLAKKLDPNDPTSWLYSALLNQEESRVNDAISDLEQSKELNDNRSIFRSRLLLDQDQAVRSANLAGMYRDAGMFEVGVQEASHAVDMDYANYSAHLFLASSYEYLRDPKLRNLRYETPAFSEYLLANLLAPPGAGALAQTISQQEYSQFFARDRFGISSSTAYESSGDWAQSASQYGVFGNSSYSLDVNYRSENGQRPNNDLEYTSLAARFKQQITDKDSLLLEVSGLNYESGDVSQYYDQGQASQTLRVKETQTPNVLLGYNHEWSPGVHTLVLGTRFDDDLKLNDSNPSLLFLRTFSSIFTPGVTNVSLVNPPFYSMDYERQLTFYSAEIQHIWQTPRNTVVLGGRYQTATADTDSGLVRNLGGPQVITAQDINSDIYRWSLYAYDYWRLLDTLQLVGGVSYDYLHYPRNIDTSPISSDETSKDQVSPKVGLTWTPFKRTELRGIYTRSMGGTFFDTSVRLEPTQIAGFNQAFRSLAPESVVGLVPGTEFETFGLGLNQSFKTGTYLLVEGQLLTSDGARTVGILTNSDINFPVADRPSGTRETVDYEERSLFVALHQLLGRDFAVGVRYRLTDADLDTRSPDIAATIPGAGVLNQHVGATLHQLRLYGIYNNPCGFFFQAEGVWSSQYNRGYSGTEPGNDFVQCNLFAGYRMLQRRLEASVGLLNVTDRDYKLNPVTLYNELPRERTFVAQFKFNF